MLKQSQWRMAGAACLALSALMAGAGPHIEFLRRSGALFLLYWSVFAIALIAAIVIAVIDLRYVRVEYALQRRALFQSTLADEEYRRALKQAQSERRAQEKGKGNPRS